MEGNGIAKSLKSTNLKVREFCNPAMLHPIYGHLENVLDSITLSTCVYHFIHTYMRAS